MSQKTVYSVGFIVILIGMLLVAFFTTRPMSTYGSSYAGADAKVATSTSYVLAANTVTPLVATSTCASRIITTSASAVMLLFTDIKGNTLTGSFGTALQAASTTVAYDSGLYGCGLVRGFSYAAQVISVVDTQ